MDLFNKQAIKELQESNRELKAELASVNKREESRLLLESKLSKGVVNLLNQDYLYELIEYVANQRVEHLLIAPTVKPGKGIEKELDEMMAGIWYGIEVYDQDKLVMEIPSLIEGDACFVSDLACKRREKNRYFINALAEYLRRGLVNERLLERVLKDVEVKESLKVGHSLFLS